MLHGVLNILLTNLLCRLLYVPPGDFKPMALEGPVQLDCILCLLRVYTPSAACLPLRSLRRLVALHDYKLGSEYVYL
jgi:hypothetical protein